VSRLIRESWLREDFQSGGILTPWCFGCEEPCWPSPAPGMLCEALVETGQQHLDICLSSQVSHHLDLTSRDYEGNELKRPDLSD